MVSVVALVSWPTPICGPSGASLSQKMQSSTSSEEPEWALIAPPWLITASLSTKVQPRITGSELVVHVMPPPLYPARFSTSRQLLTWALVVLQLIPAPQVA